MADTLTPNQREELIESLRGTCMTSLNDKLDELFGLTEMDLSSEEEDLIDMEIFVCGECSWWCEASQESEVDKGDGERYCTDCIDPDEEE